MFSFIIDAHAAKRGNHPGEGLVDKIIRLHALLVSTVPSVIFRRAASAHDQIYRTGRMHVSGGRCHGGPPRLTGKTRQTGVAAKAAMLFQRDWFPDVAKRLLGHVPVSRRHLARSRLLSAEADLFTYPDNMRSTEDVQEGRC